jgi:hypothetical protein
MTGFLPPMHFLCRENDHFVRILCIGPPSEEVIFPSIQAESRLSHDETPWYDWVGVEPIFGFRVHSQISVPPINIFFFVFLCIGVLGLYGWE